MKRRFLNMMVVPVLMVALSVGAWAQSAIPLYKSTAWDHLYTTSYAEQAWHQANLGYWPEGIESNVWSGGGSGKVPVYRLSRSVGGHLHHYYTSNEAEKNHLVSVAATGFNLDGVGFFVYNYPAAGTYPIYRVDRVYQPAQYFLWWQISPEIPADTILTMRNSERQYLLGHGYYENGTYGSLIGYAQPGNLGVN